MAPSTMIVTGPGADAAAKTIAEQLPQQLPEDVTRPDFSPRKDVNEDGSAARVDVVLNADPYSTTAFDMLDRATEQAGEIAGSEVRVASAGETATARDSAAEVTHDFTLLVPLIFLVIALILGLLLRSWLAPIYLIATLGLSFAATLGLVAYITLTVQGDTGFGRNICRADDAAHPRALPIRYGHDARHFDRHFYHPSAHGTGNRYLLGDRALLPAKPGQESREASIEPVPAS
ncbi:MMPL family transporter [Corynebacterium diphtheriae]|uniref:MMPL family transporter n=1 Tax=Corynebacterium diphtheriae TaxID=1717 RepID=UPI003BF9C993